MSHNACKKYRNASNISTLHKMAKIVFKVQEIFFKYI